MVRAATTIILMLAWTLVLLPVQIFALRFSRRELAESVPMLYHRGLAWLLRVRVQVRGTMSAERPTLFVVNHVSWLDIVVLDTLVRGSYITKREVMGWPGFGYLAQLQRCLFIERKAHRTRDHKDEMQVRLEEGDNLILFPEGTSSDGMRILPFKSSFFAVAEQHVNGRPLVVQPVSLAYCRLNHMPVGRRLMPLFAWVGNEDLLPHLWRFLRVGSSVAEVVFHSPVTLDSFGSRKELSAHCRAVIAQGVSDSLGGRRRPAGTAPAAAAHANPA